MNRPTNVPNAQELNSMLKKVVDLARLKAKSTNTFIMYDLGS